MTRPATEVEVLLAERDALAAEVQRLQRKLSQATAARFRHERKAFARGVKAMREAAVKEVYDKAHYLSVDWADDIRALPDPEDTQ